MMQTQTQNQPPQPQKKLTWKQKIKRVWFLLRNTYPKTLSYVSKENPTPDVTIAEDFRQFNVSEEDITIFNNLLLLMNKASHDVEASSKFNQFVIGGVIVLNAVLFQVLASVGTLKDTLYVAWMALAISLPCAAGSLFLAKEHGKIKNLWFPLIYTVIFNAAVFGCVIATTAFIAHSWSAAASVFAIVSAIVYGFCMFYEMISRIRRALQVQEELKKQQGTIDTSV